MERVSRSRRKHYYPGHTFRKSGVILLNADYSYLNVVSWKKAITLICKGKVEVLEASKRIIRNAERTIEILVPKIMRLIKMIRTLYKNKVPYSKRNVYIRDGFECAYCHSEPARLTLDHVQPKSRGGKSTFENTVAACKECNLKKGDQTPSECGMYLRKQPYAPTINEFLQLRMKKLGIGDVLEEYFSKI